MIFDTAGRLQIDDELVDELEHLKREINPHEILLVSDSALGQEAVNVAKTFHERLGLTGIILTKLTGMPGGTALSMKKVTGAPIKFWGPVKKWMSWKLFIRTDWHPGSWGWEMWYPWWKKHKSILMRKSLPEWLKKCSKQNSILMISSPK